VITYDDPTLRLFGIPLFTVVVGALFLGALAGLVFGVSRWRQPAGKIAVLASAVVLLLFALAVVLVLVTVGSGSMG
jgi:hypothetical protein